MQAIGSVGDPVQPTFVAKMTPDWMIDLHSKLCGILWSASLRISAYERYEIRELLGMWLQPPTERKNRTDMQYFWNLYRISSSVNVNRYFFPRTQKYKSIRQEYLEVMRSNPSNACKGIHRNSRSKKRRSINIRSFSNPAIFRKM